MATYSPTRAWQTHRQGTTYSNVAQSSTASASTELGLAEFGYVGQEKDGSTYRCWELHLAFELDPDLVSDVLAGWVNTISFSWDLEDATSATFNVLVFATSGSAPDHLSSTEMNTAFGQRVMTWTMGDANDDPEAGEEWTLNTGGTLDDRLQDAIVDTILTSPAYELVLTFASGDHRLEGAPSGTEYLTGQAMDAVLTVEVTPPVDPVFTTAAPTLAVTDKPKESAAFSVVAPVLTVPAYTGPVSAAFTTVAPELEVATSRSYSADNLFGTLVDEQRWTGDLV